MADTRPNRSWLDRATSWSPVLLLGGLAALTYWLDAQVQTPAPRRDGSARHDPDIIVEGVRVLKLDPDGRPLQLLSARRAEHFPDDLTTVFSDVALAETRAGKPPVKVTATEATLTGDRENVYFKGHVRAVREATVATAKEQASGPLTLTTEYLHVMPNKQLATTDKAVTIIDPRGIINATGMEADSGAKTIKFKSGISGHMEPRK
ncbi:MAG: LPS export ABC transporter periplasmic protein LptC [Betaproteobacteria bacterium]